MFPGELGWYPCRVRATIEAQLGRLGLRYLRTRDSEIKTAIYRFYGILDNAGRLGVQATLDPLDARHNC
jgi:hypothetical protein